MCISPPTTRRSSIGWRTCRVRMCSWPSSGQLGSRACATPARVDGARGSGAAAIEWALRDLPDRVIPVSLDATIPDPASLPRSLRRLFQNEPVRLRHQDIRRRSARTHWTYRSGRPAGTTAPGPSGERSDTRAIESPPSASAPSEDGRRSTAGIPTPYDAHYAEVMEGMLDGSVVPILGTEVRAALPYSDQLAERFQVSAPGLAEIAQRIAVTLGERRLYAAIKGLIAAQSQPTEVHRFLAAFPGLLRARKLPPRHQLIVAGELRHGAGAGVRRGRTSRLTTPSI